MRAKIESRGDLDELIGRHVLGANPEVHWEDSHSLFQFDSEEEAKEAISDAYYQLFLPEADWTSANVHQIQAFKPYSSDAQASWEVVDVMTREKPLHLHHNEGSWSAQFGEHARASSKSPFVAICLAALRAKGIEVKAAQEFVE